jgi:hypothetical protein
MASEPAPHFETPAVANHRFAPANYQPQNGDGRQSWNKIIDEVLVNWRRHPELLEDDGIDAPSDSAIAAAITAASLLRDQGAPLPTNIAPTGDGGIALHYEHNGVLLTIEFDEDGHRELRFHFGGQLVRLGESAGT